MSFCSYSENPDGVFMAPAMLLGLLFVLAQVLGWGSPRF
jgi:hypothetical protein